MVEVHGKTTINPWLFYTGKAAGFFTWFAGLYVYFRGTHLHQAAGRGFDLAALVMLIPGILLVLFSSFTLGSSLRIGLPVQETRLLTKGLYRLSRNPLYVGLHLITLAAMAYTLKWWVILPGLYSMWIYHLIIKGEERFLEERFGEAYLHYRKTTRRYL